MSTYTGPERRMQLDLRKLVAQKRAWGWDLVSRQPLQMRRGRAVLDMYVPGVVTTRLEPTMKQFSEKKKRGCPTCSGVDARSCMRCQGKTRMCDWYNTETGWAHYTQLNHDERAKANDAHASG